MTWTIDNDFGTTAGTTGAESVTEFDIYGLDSADATDEVHDATNNATLNNTTDERLKSAGDDVTETHDPTKNATLRSATDEIIVGAGDDVTEDEANDAIVDYSTVLLELWKQKGKDQHIDQLIRMIIVKKAMEEKKNSDPVFKELSEIGLTPIDVLEALGRLEKKRNGLHSD